MNHDHHGLELTRAGIDTYQQLVVFMHKDCHICRAEGFSAMTRLQIDCDGKTIVATLNVVTGDWLGPGTAALSEAAWRALSPRPGAIGQFSHPAPPASASALRAKVYGQRLDQRAFAALMQDTIARRLSDIELAAFVTACAGPRLDLAETLALTKAMLAIGDRIDWGKPRVLDKHCVGGLPGNRTTPIVVAIVAAAGEVIPKTSSRAITSPAGTADTMEVMAPVMLDLPTMRRVVEQEGGCVVWGGNARLSPADDVLIQVERPLDFDSEGQMVASILSKKAAAGSSHILIDLPVGPTAKVRDATAAEALTERLTATAAGLGLTLRVRATDGSQPVGFGIGPALEAQDVLAVLRGLPHAPQDLRSRALDLAGDLLEFSPGAMQGSGRARAEALLDSGKALEKFMAICTAQGGFSEPPVAALSHTVTARTSGTLRQIDNRRLAKIAKLAGAPDMPEAGVLCHVRIGERIEAGQPLFQICSMLHGTLDYAVGFARSNPDVFDITEAT